MATPKYAIATELLNNALRLYFEQGSDYSALHLAGAAEEIFSVYVRALKDENGKSLVPVFDSSKEAVARLTERPPGTNIQQVERDIADLMNAAKNATKHKKGRGDNAADFDARAEAKEVLDRAVSTYYQLASSLRLPHATPLLVKFNEEQRQA
jgi:hypothetical protein